MSAHACRIAEVFSSFQLQSEGAPSRDHGFFLLLKRHEVRSQQRWELSGKRNILPHGVSDARALGFDILKDKHLDLFDKWQDESGQSDIAR